MRPWRCRHPIAAKNLWTAVLLFLASRAQVFDRWTGADLTALNRLRDSIEQYQAQHARIPALADIMVILAIGLGATGLSHFLSELLVRWITSLPNEWRLQDYSLISGFFWIVVIAATIGLLLSFTKARTFQGAGASRIGSVMMHVPALRASAR